MSSGLRTLLIVLGIAAGIALLVWFATRPQPVAVVLATVDQGRVEATVANTRAGTVTACRRAQMAPATGGQIARLPVKEGDRVETDQVLMEMWNQDIRAELLLSALQRSLDDGHACFADLRGRAGSLACRPLRPRIAHSPVGILLGSQLLLA